MGLRLVDDAFGVGVCRGAIAEDWSWRVEGGEHGVDALFVVRIGREALAGDADGGGEDGGAVERAEGIERD
ncbi:MAG: hypothetical protein R3B46_09890 [Phycisphaerales bacterium]